MILPESEYYRLLYTDELGDDVGLDEVQLLDPPLEERVSALTVMLNSSDKYISYQSALILTAWGKYIGLQKVEEFIDKEVISNLGFSPHRITGEDNVYDELAYAIYLYELMEGDRENVVRLFKKLLALYSKYFFQSKLKHSLLTSDFFELVPAIECAINEAFTFGRIYQASQLLPVLTKFDSEKGWCVAKRFIGLSESVPDPAANVAEALKYCPFSNAKEILLRYSASESPGVADEAIKSLAKLNN